MHPPAAVRKWELVPAEVWAPSQTHPTGFGLCIAVWAPTEQRFWGRSTHTIHFPCTRTSGEEAQKPRAERGRGLQLSLEKRV